MKFRAIALLLASGVLVVVVPASAQSLAEASEAAKQIHHEWPLSTNAGPKAAPPLTTAEVDAFRSTFDTVYTTGKALDSAAGSGTMLQVREKLIAFQAALAIVADHPTPAAGETVLLAKYQEAAPHFSAGLDLWMFSIQSHMTNTAGKEFKKASDALDAANKIYLGKEPK